MVTSTIDRLQDATDVLLDRFNATLSRGVEQEIARLAQRWFDGDRAARTELFKLGRETIAPLMLVNANAAAELTAQWYEFERSRLDVKGKWAGPVLTIPDIQEQIGEIVGGSVKDAKTTNGLVEFIQAGAEQRVMESVNGTMLSTGARDSQVHGWRRSLGGSKSGPCEFCAMLTLNVYRSQQSSSFRSHAGCRCTSWMEFNGKVVQAPQRDYEKRVYSNDPERDAQMRAAQTSDAREWIERNRAQLDIIRSIPPDASIKALIG